MAMKIIIGKFGEDGEPIWFEVESNDYKDGEAVEEKEGSIRHSGLPQQSDTDRSGGGSAKPDA